MANNNFVVQNGLTVGPLTISATTGDISTTGNISISGPGQINVTNIGVSSIAQNDTSVAIYDTGTGSNVRIIIDGTTEQTIDGSGVNIATGGHYAINGTSVLDATTLGSAVVASSLTSVGTLTGLTSSGAVSITDTTNTTTTATGALKVSGGATFNGNAYIADTMYVGPNAFNVAVGAPAIVATNSGANYAQIAMKNTNANGSSDFAAYGDTGSDVSGWSDMGFTGTTFNDGNYTITKPNDGYFFVSPYSTSYGGNLVLATSEHGSTNDVIIGVGSFHANAEVARFHGNATTGGYLALKQGTAATNTTSGALQVTGGVGVSGAVYAGSLYDTGDRVLTSVSTASALTSVGTLTGLTSSGVVHITDTSSTTDGVGGTGTGALRVAGGASVEGNVYVGGNLHVVGNTTFSYTTISQEQLPGGLVLGLPLNFTALNANLTLGGNQDTYMQQIIQNQNSGSAASSDYVAAADNGTDSINFIDMGINSSTYSQAGYTLNYPNDGYVYVQGNGTNVGGNLILATMTGRDVIFATGGQNTNNEVMRITSANVVNVKSTVTSTSTTTGALIVAGGVGVAGKINATDLTVTNTISGSINGAAPAGSLTGATLASGVTASSLTSVGTLTGLSVSGNVVPTANATVNLGDSTHWFGTLYGVSTQAKYADLAENYQADKNYNPGTVLMFGGANEVTVAAADTTAVAGVVSTNPAHLMNGQLTGPNVVALALTGRVPCNVVGPVKKGDLMVSAGFGFAKANNTPGVGQVIGKALEDFPITAKGVIEVVVGRF